MVKFAEAMAGEKGLKPLAGKSKEMVLAVVQKGWELGLTPMEALENVYVVDNSLYVNSFIMRSNAQKNGVKIERVEEGPEHCTVRITRPDMPNAPFEYTYTLAQARQAGVVRQGGNWEKYPDRMLFARATRNCLRDHCADLIGTADYREPEEIEDLESPVRPRVVAQDGEPVPDPTVREPKIDPDVVDEIHDLLTALAEGVAERQGLDVNAASAKIIPDFSAWKSRTLGINKTEEAKASDEPELRRYVRKRYKAYGVPFSETSNTGADDAEDAEDADFDAINTDIVQLRARWQSEGLNADHIAQILVTASAACDSVIDDIDNASGEQIAALQAATDEKLMEFAEQVGQGEEPELAPEPEPHRLDV